VGIAALFVAASVNAQYEPSTQRGEGAFDFERTKEAAIRTARIKSMADLAGYLERVPVELSPFAPLSAEGRAE
jgi:hypothetical protein